MCKPNLIMDHNNRQSKHFFKYRITQFLYFSVSICELHCESSVKAEFKNDFYPLEYFQFLIQTIQQVPHHV